MPDETPAPVCFAFSGEMWKERREVSTVSLVQYIIFGSWSQMHRPKCSFIFDSFILSFCPSEGGTFFSRSTLSRKFPSLPPRPEKSPVPFSLANFFRPGH